MGNRHSKFPAITTVNDPQARARHSGALRQQCAMSGAAVEIPLLEYDVESSILQGASLLLL